MSWLHFTNDQLFITTHNKYRLKHRQPTILRWVCSSLTSPWCYSFIQHQHLYGEVAIINRKKKIYNICPNLGGVNFLWSISYYYYYYYYITLYCYIGTNGLQQTNCDCADDVCNPVYGSNKGIYQSYLSTFSFHILYIYL